MYITHKKNTQSGKETPALAFGKKVTIFVVLVILVLGLEMSVYYVFFALRSDTLETRSNGEESGREVEQQTASDDENGGVAQHVRFEVVRFEETPELSSARDTAIYLYIQEGVSVFHEQRVTGVLESLLESSSPTQVSLTRGAAAQELASRRASVLLFTTSEEENAYRSSADAVLADGPFVMLNARDVPLEGAPAYMQSFTLDRSIGAVSQLIVSSGIKYADPQLYEEIQRAAQDALERGVWQPAPVLGDADVPSEVFFALSAEVYFGLWAHNPYGDNSAGQNGQYAYGTREQMRRADEKIVKILDSFYPKFLTYEAMIDPLYEGTFFLEWREESEYTHKSQYLRDARLIGENHSRLVGNDQANTLTGNAGDNELIGRGGNDTIDGADGEDIVVYDNPSEEYEVVRDGSLVRIRHEHGERTDGVDTLFNVEYIRFPDTTQNI
jgi:hypothetical protein